MIANNLSGKKTFVCVDSTSLCNMAYQKFVLYRNGLATGSFMEGDKTQDNESSNVESSYVE